MEESRKVLLGEIAKQLDKRPWNHSLGTGIITLGDLGDSYYKELILLQKLLQGIGLDLQEESNQDRQRVFTISSWALPTFCRYPYAILDPDYSRNELLDLQNASRPGREDLYTDDIWENQQLHAWATAEQSSLLSIQCSYTSISRTEKFSAEICEFVSEKQPLVHMLRSPSTSEVFELWGGCQLLRHLVILALRQLSVSNPVEFLLDFVPPFMEASTFDEWFGVLEYVLEMSQGLFLVIDISVLGGRAEEAKTWPEHFRRIMARLHINSGVSLRVLLISTHPTWFQSDSLPLLLVGATPKIRPSHQTFGMAQRNAPVQRDLPLHLPSKTVAAPEMEAQIEQNHRIEYHKSPPKNALRQTPQSIGQHQVSTAVLCALTPEADAVEALFDRCLTVEYSRTMGDTNTYSFGVIHQHNIVLVHMPGMGTRHAASVAAHCGATFPTVGLVLIIGICGGVPFIRGGTEVLLGDVAVSEDLVIYDFGRQYPDTFVRKRGKVESARKPPAEILGFLAKLKGRSMQKVLSEKAMIHMEALREELGSLATYPGAQRDILFQSEYHHKHQDPSSCEECRFSELALGCVCEESRVSSCSELKCDTAKSITRQRQKDWLQEGQTGQVGYCPVLHIGRFASGDKVMKSGEDRDDIARSEGVIAFEMEGGGVWDNMPCIIIKGICDYADSHKDKRWQGYASATAAAYMKAVLEEWRK